jgi:hypothetical protein
MAPVAEVLETVPRTAWLLGGTRTCSADAPVVDIRAPAVSPWASRTLVPMPSVSGSSWAVEPNPEAGMLELDWFERNRHQLANFAGLWIAILGLRIVASGESFDQVQRDVDAMALRDALIVHVPEDSTRWDYLIA